VPSNFWATEVWSLSSCVSLYECLVQLAVLFSERWSHEHTHYLSRHISCFLQGFVRANIGDLMKLWGTTVKTTSSKQTVELKKKPSKEVEVLWRTWKRDREFSLLFLTCIVRPHSTNCTRWNVFFKKTFSMSLPSSFRKIPLRECNAGYRKKDFYLNGSGVVPPRCINGRRRTVVCIWIHFTIFLKYENDTVLPANSRSYSRRVEA